MKKILLSLVAMFAAVTVASAVTVTVNVTVPKGTPTCYLYGFISGNKFVQMTSTGTNTFSWTSADVDVADVNNWGYKFAWSNIWDTQANPETTYQVYDGAMNDVAGWKTSPTAPSGQVVVTVQTSDAVSAIYAVGSFNGWDPSNGTYPLVKSGSNWTVTLPSAIGYDVKFISGLGSSSADWQYAQTQEGNYTVSFSGNPNLITDVTFKSIATSIGEASFDANVYATAGTITVGAENFSILTLAGVDVTAQNGSLANGQYIVKLANGAAQVVVLK